MKKKIKKIQLTLLSIGFLLFFGTYFYYPNLNTKKISKEQNLKINIEEVFNEDQITALENMEYKGLYDFNKPFSIKSTSAFILNENPDIVYMKNMQVTLKLEDNRIVKITSAKGLYNKFNYNCFFEQDVKATDGEIIITAENLDLVATKNFVEIYNSVFVDYITGSLYADKIDYDFETKHFKVSMFDDKSVKMKINQ